MFWVPAGDSVTWDYCTAPSVQAVVWLQGTGALTGRPFQGDVAGITQALSLVGPTVHHAARKLVASQELTGICLVSWSKKNKKGSADEKRNGKEKEQSDATCMAAESVTLVFYFSVHFLATLALIRLFIYQSIYGYYDLV